MLLVTNDDVIHDEVSRLAANAALPIEVVPGPGEAMTAWRRASLVLVGGDCAGSMARLRPSRRRCVAVVQASIAYPDIYRDALDIGAAQVLALPETRDWLDDAIAEALLEDAQRGVTVGVIGAAGGVGATSLATAVACAGADRVSTVLVDLDPLGMGVERVLGHDSESVTNWSTLGAQALSPRGLRETLPNFDGVHVVGFGAESPRPIEGSAAISVLTACAQAFDLTVVDIPRTLTAAAQEAVVRCDLLVLMCPQALTAVASGRRTAAALRGVHELALVTRAGPRQVDPTGIAEALGVDLLIAVNDQRGMEEAFAAQLGPLRSRGPGLRRTAEAILDHLLVGA